MVLTLPGGLAPFPRSAEGRFCFFFAGLSGARNSPQKPRPTFHLLPLLWFAGNGKTVIAITKKGDVGHLPSTRLR